MTTKTTIALLAMFAATPALAHPGEHETMAIDTLAAHVASHPFHVAGLLALAGVVAGIGLVMRSRKLSHNQSRRAD